MGFGNGKMMILQPGSNAFLFDCSFGRGSNATSLRRPSIASETDSESSSSSLSSSSTLSLTSFPSSIKGTSGNNNNKKKRVRFNDHGILFNKKKSVRCKVHTFERVHVADQGSVWWNADERMGMRKANDELAATDAARAYLSDSFLVLQRVYELSSTRQGEDEEERPRDYLQGLAGVRGSATGREVVEFRGLEKRHGPCGVQRQFRSEETIQDVVRAYRERTKKAACKNSDKNDYDDDDDDIHEEIRRFARNLTRPMRDLASLYGAIDALPVQAE